MKCNLKYIIISFYCVLHFMDVGAQASNFPVRNGIEFSPRWLDNLIFLNNIEEEFPTEKQILYKWAETRLACQTNDGFASLSEYPAFRDYCSKQNILLLGGPMLGNITDNSVDIWVRTGRPEKVTVKVNINGTIKEFGPVETTTATELSAIVRITGLKPDSKYPYQVFVEGQKCVIPDNASIRTLSNSDNINTRIVFGSCFHRWGLGNKKQSNTIIGRNPHAFLGLGDIAAQDKNNSLGWHSLDFLARDLYPAWQNIASQIPIYVTWDDHDYFDNDKGGIPEGYSHHDRDNVWKAFRYAWNNPSYGFGEKGKGIFFRSRIGAADVIMLDGRFFREKGNYLGDQQLEWLETELLDCKGPFVILANGSMWSDYVSGGKDSWGVYDPEAREKIFNLIENNNIKGVLLISGDRHGARGFRIPRMSGFNFYEFEVASLGGLGGAPATRPEWTTQLYGISGGFAFGEFTFNTALQDPTVTFRLIGEEGDIIYELTLKQSEITPAKYE